MCNACGLSVNSLCMNCGLQNYYSHVAVSHFYIHLDKHTVLRILHKFYTQFFTIHITFFQSVNLWFYTVFTPLIITKTNYKK